MQLLRFLLVLLLFSLGPAAPAGAQQITVYSSGSVPVSSSRQLTAYVPLVVNTAAWAVNGVPGGNSVFGTVSAAGLYNAPAVVPAANAVKVSATSTAQPDKSGFVTLTITQVPPRLWSSAPRSVPVGAFTLSLNGAYFTANAVLRFGDVDLPTTWVSSTQLRASGTANAAQVGSNVVLRVRQTGLGGVFSDVVTVGVTAASTTPVPTPTPTPVPTPTPTPTPGPMPDPGTGQGTPNLKAARLLEQAAFGPTPAALARVNQIGIDAWLNEQLAMPETTIPDPGSGGMNNSVMQAQYLARLSSAPDQLRQRMAYALGQIIVVSMNKNNYPNEIIPYLQILSRHAFGNYRALLGEIATSPQMGKYLDMANSNKPGPGSGGANENFPRELMQLFSLGLVKLNLDGTPATGAAGAPLPTYDQNTVAQLALAFTGWTYAGAGNNNWENFSGPLQPRDVNHDKTAKQLLGCSLPANQGALQDLVAALDCVFAHPNVAPFIATRLIRSLVGSNPSPAYVARVATVFNNNGSGQRGDLRAVLRAVLLDAEARNDVASVNSGRLKDPIFHVVSVVRALGGNVSPTNQQAWSFSRLGETPLAAPSVFSFYSPLFRIPHTALSGPEFQIYSPTEAVLRGNFFWQILSNPGSDFPLDLSRFVNLGGNTAALIDAVDQALLYGRMPAAMRQSLANAVVAQQDNRSRALTALYLTLLAGQQAVQY